MSSFSGPITEFLIKTFQYIWAAAATRCCGMQKEKKSSPSLSTAQSTTRFSLRFAAVSSYQFQKTKSGKSDTRFLS